MVGVPAAGVTEANAERCEAAARHLRWDGEQLHIRGKDGTERVVVPWVDRKKLVRQLAA